MRQHHKRQTPGSKTSEMHPSPHSFVIPQLSKLAPHPLNHPHGIFNTHVFPRAKDANVEMCVSTFACAPLRDPHFDIDGWLEGIC
jgi:hypothetical protein